MEDASIALIFAEAEGFSWKRKSGVDGGPGGEKERQGGWGIGRR